jgi:hypothetical protein
MVFTEESAVVRTWVRLVSNGDYTREQVPAIGNLQEVVYNILDKQ